MVQYICGKKEGGTQCSAELSLACMFALTFILHLPSPLFLLFFLSFTLNPLPLVFIYSLASLPSPHLPIFSPLPLYLTTLLPCTLPLPSLFLYHPPSRSLSSSVNWSLNPVRVRLQLTLPQLHMSTLAPHLLPLYSGWDGAASPLQGKRDGESWGSWGQG